MTHYLVKASSLKGFRKMVEELGGDADELLRHSGLEDPEMDPEAWISYRSFLTLLDEASVVTNCPHFGLRLSRHQDIGMAWRFDLHRLRLRRQRKTKRAKDDCGKVDAHDVLLRRVLCGPYGGILA